MNEKREIPQEEVRARLEALRREVDRGQAELKEVELRRKYLHETLLRIDGAIQVLQELAEGRPAEQDGIVPREIRPVSEAAGSTPGVP